MEGVGARLGRSSTRYGPATVFTGPVRKWKKKWVPIPPSSSASSNPNNNHNHSSSNGNNGSHLQLYKWTPITQSQNTNEGNTNEGNSNASKDAPEPSEEPPPRKFKYIPVAVLEEQRNEAAENEAAEKIEDEAKPIADDPSAAEPTRMNENRDEKPDINDVPMEESEPQDKNQVVRQDLNESLDLSLGLTSHDDGHDSDSKTQTRDDQ